MVKKSSIKVATVSKGPVKPMHSVGQPPILGWDDYSMFHYLKEIGVKYSRLHDTGGAFGNGRIPFTAHFDVTTDFRYWQSCGTQTMHNLQPGKIVV